MARAHPMELGQIKFGPVEMMVPPMKVRVHLNFLPDFTIDLSKKPTTGGISTIFRPKATVLIGEKAYLLDPWGKKIMEEANPKIFERPTTFDYVTEIGIIPTMIFVGLIGYFGYRLFRSWRSK
ncbi:MAG: hypothetical protein K6T73_01235 [Candidatus Bathyarchaeota archaeon]|nr:hypothetical protein [Candidatus Bathyarchaeota archaeon]